VLNPDPTNLSRILSANDLRISNTVVTMDLIWRHRGEKFTPYVMAGPGIMFAQLDAGSLFSSDGKQDDNDNAFAYKVGFGFSYKLSDSMHIFTAYRYISGNPKYDLERSSEPVTGALVNKDLELDVYTHAAVGGVSIRF
jgi:opacity protein-like surface antigen